MLEQVPEQEVTAAAGHAGTAEVPGGEPVGEASVQCVEGCERVEHFSVATRGRCSSGDDVGTVGAVVSGRPRERDTRGECLVESITEGPGLLGAQVEGLSGYLEDDVVTGDGGVDIVFVVDEFLDQE